MLNEKEKRKYEIIQKVENKEISRKEASYELQVSLRQIDKLRLTYRSEGEQGFIHKSRGKKSKKKINQNIIEEIENIYLTEFCDFNFVAFYEAINEKEKYKGKYDISYSTLYNAFLNDDIISPIAHKGTIRLYNEKMNNSISENKKIQQEKLA